MSNWISKIRILIKNKTNLSFGAKMADETMTSDSSIDSVDELGKAFKKYLSQRQKDPNDAKDTASVAVEETLVNANEKGKKKTKKAPAKIEESRR